MAGFNRSLEEVAPVSLSKVIAQFNESVIRRTTIHARQYQAINLAQGFPDEDTPQEFKQVAIDAIAAGRNKYADTWGVEQLRDAVVRKMKNLYGVDIDPAKNVTVTCGSTESMAATLFALIDPGDEVILFEPAYENFIPQCRLARAKPVTIPLTGDAFAFDRDQLANAFNSNTKAIILNNPNNPSGKVFSQDELAFIGQLCVQHGAYVIADEVYEHLVYDGRKHHTLASISACGANWIVMSSCSKTYFMTGWRVGYVIAPQETTNGIRRCHDFLTGMAPTPLQDAAAIALGVPDRFYESLRTRFGERRKRLVKILNDLELACVPPEGAYYVLADMSRYDFPTSTEFCEYLLKQVGVAAVPWRSFYADPAGRHKVRFTFSKSTDNLVEAGRRMETGLANLRRYSGEG